MTFVRVSVPGSILYLNTIAPSWQDSECVSTILFYSKCMACSIFVGLASCHTVFKATPYGTSKRVESVMDEPWQIFEVLGSSRVGRPLGRPMLWKIIVNQEIWGQTNLNCEVTWRKSNFKSLCVLERQWDASWVFNAMWRENFRLPRYQWEELKLARDYKRLLRCFMVFVWQAIQCCNFSNTGGVG